MLFTQNHIVLWSFKTNTKQTQFLRSMIALELTLHPKRYNTTVLYCEQYKKSLRIKSVINPVNPETNREKKPSKLLSPYSILPKGSPKRNNKG